MAKGACVAGEMATAADGTHPTGMHSCVLILAYILCLERDVVNVFQSCVASP